MSGVLRQLRRPMAWCVAGGCRIIFSGNERQQMTVILGIDPGHGGAIARYDSATRACTVVDMPLAVTTKGRSMLDLHALMPLLERAKDVRTVVALEQVAAQAGDGAAGAFTFGRGYGALEAAAVSHGLELRHVPPSVWKKHFGLIFPAGTAKAAIKSASRALAQQRLPSMAGSFSRIKDDGRAEACLIALYAAEVGF